MQNEGRLQATSYYRLQAVGLLIFQQQLMPQMVNDYTKKSTLTLRRHREWAAAPSPLPQANDDDPSCPLVNAIVNKIVNKEYVNATATSSTDTLHVSKPVFCHRFRSSSSSIHHAWLRWLRTCVARSALALLPRVLSDQLGED